MSPESFLSGDVDDLTDPDMLWEYVCSIAGHVTSV